MPQRRNPITISRRALAAALIASCGTGLLAGSLAAAPASSQARAIEAAAPPACKSFAVDVAAALRSLSTVVGDEGHYATLIPQAYHDGATHDGSAYTALGVNLASLVKGVAAQNTAFSKLEAPLLSTEKACLAN
jgi:hypothetical protein